jgi:hypothetical protein
MSTSNVFQTGYLKLSAQRGEEIFLSVTPGFERGPGIERDGITLPRMADPHTIQRVMREKKLHASDYPTADFPFTTNAWVQRAGTWTLFNHLQRFLAEHGEDYLVIGVQSCGDLTMNPWHVALIHQHGRPQLCFLKSERRDGLEEPLGERSYRCLVKWKSGLRDCCYEFIDLEFRETVAGFQANIVDRPFLKAHSQSLKEKGIDTRNISESVDFALSGKPIVEKGMDLSMANAVDRFQDVRHIFNLPSVKASGAIGSQNISQINFGEHVLYNDLNARRAALNSAILVSLKVANTEVKWDELESLLLKEKHYRLTIESPTRRGEFRRYSEDTVEIFYPHNVYPFGVLGGKPGELVCLSSGGLSGRVGNTLDGITRIAYDFFGCHDAIVLDEGFDTFHLVNPNPKAKEAGPDCYSCDNNSLLKQAAEFTKWRAQADHDESVKSSRPDGLTDTENHNARVIKDEMEKRFENWPLNKPVFSELESFCEAKKITAKAPRQLDAFAVPPLRSQMRAVIIFAVRKNTSNRAAEKQ